MDPDFTDLAARQFVAVGIDDDDVAPGQGKPTLSMCAR